jgi:putative membrane protein
MRKVSLEFHKMRTALIVTSVLLILAILAGAGLVIARIVAPAGIGFDRDFGGRFGHHPFWGFTNVGWLGMGLIMLAMLFLWLLVPLGIGAAIWWAVSRGRERPSDRRPESSLEILRRRYAQGEITREEFIERRETLQGKSNGGNQL